MIIELAYRLNSLIAFALNKRILNYASIPILGGGGDVCPCMPEMKRPLPVVIVNTK